MILTSSPVTVTLARDGAAWDAYVAQHRDATGCHLWDWQHVFTRAFGHECLYLVAHRGLGAPSPSASPIAGVLPLVFFNSRLFGRFLVSLPFLNSGGVLADDADAAARLLEHASECARTRHATHIELRHRGRQFPTLPHKEHKVAMALPLASSEDRAWAGLDRKVRNQIRKAERSELTAHIGGRELLAAFYDVYAERMRDLGTPVYSRGFFEQVCARFPDRTRVFLIRHHSGSAAAGISFAHRGRIEVPWAASRRLHRHRCPNNLLYWTIIRHAIAHRFDTLDFGRSTRGEGTYEFKRQWGASEEPLYWEYQLLGHAPLPNLSPTNASFKPAIAMWKHLPIAATRLIGPPIVRSIP